MLMTFDEWKAKGYSILKGSKATWVKDKPMFSDAQVYQYIPYHRSATPKPWLGKLSDRVSKRSFYKEDYNEEDYAINDYDLCVNGW